MGDTATLDVNLRKELCANLGDVRQKIQAVSNECMQELARAQLLLIDKEDTRSGLWSHASHQPNGHTSETYSPLSSLARSTPQHSPARSAFLRRNSTSAEGI